MPVSSPAVGRFWDKVNKNGAVPEARPDLGACWEWTAHKNAKGYGRFGHASRHLILAHRFAYELLVGPIPVDLVIDHLCRNPGCVNPAHMEPVTPAENTRRGRGNGWKYWTACPNGHPFDDENTYLRPDGRRGCRTCRRESDRAYRARRAAA